MRRANVVEKDMAGIGTLKDLTNVFESLASTQVAKVKNKAQLSQQFFNLLWKRYTAIRVDPICPAFASRPGGERVQKRR